MNEAEIWRPVEGWPTYEVSNLGRVKCLLRRKLPKGTPDHKGYLRIKLCHSGRQLTRPIHLLVAAAFLPPKPTPQHEANHEDGIKANNRASNLTWMSSGQNQTHAYRTGLRLPNVGTKNGRAKLTPSRVEEIRRSSLPETVLASQYGISRSNVGRIRRAETW